MKKTRINPISEKRKAEMLKERELEQVLFEKQHGRCADCKQYPDWRGLSKHEIIFRSQGGDSTDPNNCILLCGKCHDKRHHLREAEGGYNEGSHGI